jgi:Raf kinase inhibitor-like YbhB/YbcL family protein
MRKFALYPWVSHCLFGALPGLMAALPVGGFGTPPIGSEFPASWGMSLYSPAFLENGYIPSKYTCDGENVSPPLHIRGVSAKARSLVLVMEDPDALGGDWVHWTVWNMEASTRVISENSIPEGSVEGDTDFDLPAWAGPCPREGVHRYVFRLYALDVKLELPSRADKRQLAKALNGHIVDQSLLVGLYGRDPVRAATDSWIQRKFTN